MNTAVKDAKIPASGFRHTANEIWDTGTAAQEAGRPPLGSSLWRVAWIMMDVLMWAGCAGVCIALFRWLEVPLFVPNPRILILPCAVSLFCGWLVGAYDRDISFLSLRFASESLIAGVMATFVGPGLVALFGNYGGAFQPSRLFLVVIPIAYTILSLLTRRWLWRAVGGAALNRRVIVIGAPEESAALEAALHLTERVVEVQHLCPTAAADGQLAAMLHAANLKSEDASRRFHDTVVIGPSAAGGVLNSLGPFLVSLHSSTVPVYSWAAFWSLRVRMHDCSASSAEWLFDRDCQLAQSSAYWHLKRVTDLVLSAIALVLCLPVLIITAIVIRIDSRGAAIFTQERVGFRGRLFTIYKFRTMRKGSEKDGATTTKGDSRLTRVGRILRKYRIDEIPQLLNVLKGDMSIVGPRPEWTVCVNEYEKILPCYHLRHLVKPGLTGWAQVNYPYGENVEDARKKLAFDIFYISHASLVLDCSIILKTLYVLIGKVGGR